MTARDDLHEVMCGDECGRAKRCERTERLIDAFAHQLAEQQRTEWATIRGAITQIHPDDIAGLIDLIDPEAEE